MKKDIFMNIHQLSTGFIEIPNKISLNIYAQGCKNSCYNCQNPDLQKFEGGIRLYLKDIDVVLKDYPLCTWICWLGGDAIYQSKALIAFSKEFKKRGLNICLYTGKTFEELDNEIWYNLDMIIDGKWNGKPIQDSKTNQKIWVLAPGIEWYQVTWKELKKMYKEK